MISRRYLLFITLLIAGIQLNGQIKISGFVFETGNRGYINQAVVTLSNEAQTEFYGQVTTDQTGAYEFNVGRAGNFMVTVEKLPYFDYQELITIGKDQGPTVYLKHEIQRNPGYVFEITLAEKDPIPDAPTDALKGALVEVYNNTKRQEVISIESLEVPEFKIDLIKGNHYTLLIRKPGFLSKRMEAFVNVNGCILCFEGIGSVNPGVSDNLTEANSMGVLLANVEMDRYFEGKVIGLNDIYYDFGKSDITDAAAKELDKVSEFLKDNPAITVELGSHTDSRGGAKANMALSEKRAKAAVNYLVSKGGIAAKKIAAKGYGETQLANDCGDGSNCSDEEHQKNRRTVLKVLDVVNEGMQRRLRQMKAEEFMDEILADLDSQGQIRVQEGETVEEALNKGNQSYTQASSTPPSSVVVSNEDFIAEQAVPVEIEETIPAIEEVAPPMPRKKMPVKTEIVEEEMVESTSLEPEVAASDPTEIVKEEAQQVIAEVKQEIEKPKVVVAPKVVENTAIAEIPKKIERPTKPMDQGPPAQDISTISDVAVGDGNVRAEEATEKVVAVSQVIKQDKKASETPMAQTPVTKAKKVAEAIPSSSPVEEWIRPGSSTFNKAPTNNSISNRYSATYTGFKTVIIFSRFELPKEHQVYSKYKDVDIYTTADGNKLYMVGSHPSKAEAFNEMNDMLKKEYPHCYVVGFENGVRTY